MESIPTLCGGINDQPPMNWEPLGLSRSLSQLKQESTILNYLHPANRFRLMFGQSLLPSDSGLENYKAAMLKNGCDPEELNLIISGNGRLNSRNPNDDLPIFLAEAISSRPEC